MTDIVEFLTARLDEDEAAAHEDERAPGFWSRVFYPARVLAEVKAKRGLIEIAFDHAAKIDGEWGCCHSAESIKAGRCEDERPEDQAILRTLAELYDSHPDYDPAWQRSLTH